MNKKGHFLINFVTKDKHESGNNWIARTSFE